MGYRRRKKVTRIRRRAAPAGPVGRPRLTEAEMLARVPDKPILTTTDVQHVFGDVHVVTIYKMIQRGELTPYRTRQRGRSNVYKREEVVAAIRARFKLRPRTPSKGDSK